MIYDTYKVTFVLALVAGYVITTLVINRKARHNVECCGVLSLLSAIFNTEIIYRVFGILHLRPHSGEEFDSFVCGVVGVILGHISLWKHKRKNHQYDGRTIAILGLVLSYLWVIYWIGFVVLFVLCSNWK